MKFLFLYPTTDTFSLERGEKSFLYAPPLGPLYLASMLIENGHEVKVLDTRGEENAGDKIRRALNSVDAVGITIPTFALDNSERIVKIVKEMQPDMPVIAGGPHPTLYPHASMTEMNIDMLCLGEGENSILDMVAILEGRKNAKEGRGVYYRKNGEVKKGREPEVIKNIDAIPFPAHELVERYDYGYSYGFKLFEGKTTAILTSRGCPRKCTFCSRRLLSMGSYRIRSAENVVDEIEMLYERGYKNIILADDNFMSNLKRVNKIMDMILDRGIDITMFVNGARVDSADKATYKKMWKAGVRMISFGLESGNQEILDFYRKEITLEQIRKAVQLSHKTGFFTIGNFIIGAPVEREEHIRKTIDFACSLPLDMAEFFILRYMPGSQLWEEAVAEGKISEDEYMVESDSERGLGNFTREELLHWKNVAYKRFYLRPSYVAGEVFKFLSRMDIRLLNAGFSLLKILLYRTEKDEKVWKSVEQH